MGTDYDGFPPGTPNKDEKKTNLVVRAEANVVFLAGQADL